MSYREPIAARTIISIANKITAQRNEQVKKLGLTAEQADALVFFHNHPGESINGLKDELRVRHQTASGIVNRLKAKKLIHLTQSKDDKRARRISLTNAGERVFEQLQASGGETGDGLLQGMNEDDQREFMRLLEQADRNTDV